MRLRTPFQRDRDRIVHSKPFRRLKGKTQVFIDPEGRPLPDAHDPRPRDHRDLARRGAGAPAQRGSRRGDRARARHGPHPVRARRRGRARRGLAGAIRRRFPAQRAVASDRASRSISPTRSATASSRTPGRASRRRWRARSSGSSTASPTSTTTSTTPCATAAREGDLPRDEIALLGTTGSERIDTLVHDSSRRPRRPATSFRARRSGTRCCRCGRSCSSASTRRPGRAGAPAGRAGRARDLRPACGASPSGYRRATERSGQGHRLPGRDDRPLRARVCRAPLGEGRPWRGSRTAPSRGQGGRRHRRGRLRPHVVATRLRRPLHRSLPVSRGADAQLLRRPGREALLLLRLREGRRRRSRFVQETENLDFVGVVEWLADDSASLDYEEGSPRAGGGAPAARPAVRGARAGRRRTSSGLLWDGEAGAPVREYLAVARARRGDREGVPARALAGSRPRREGAGAGVHDRRAADGRAREPRAGTTTSPAADVPPRRRARQHPRLPGAQAARRRPAPRQVRELAGERALPQGQRPLRAPPREAGDREAGPRRRRRGQHGRDGAPAGRLRAGGRVDGHGADGAAAPRARPAHEAALPLLRRRRSRSGGDAAWDGARRAAGFRRPGRRASRRDRIRRTRRRRSRRGSARRRATSTTACGSRSSAPRDRQEAFVRAREILGPFEDSPERQEALRLVADRLDLPRETLAGLAPARARGTGGAAPPATPRLLEAGLQRERDLLAAVVRNPLLLEELAALTPEHFDDPLHRRFREVLVAGAAEDDELVALRAELGARADRDEIDERTGKELCCGSTSGVCVVSCRGRVPTSSARPSSRRVSRRSTRRSPSLSELAGP